MKKILTCLLFAVTTGAYCQKADTFVVHFALRETTINKTIAGQLDKFISRKKLQPGQKITILGFADYRGTAEHNDTVSTERAINVQEYLAGKGLNKADMTTSGKGKIDRQMTGKSGYAPDRKVLIITSAVTKMDVKNLKVNETVTLKNIFFEGGLPDILPSSMAELENLRNFLLQNKGVTIQIEGHVCCKGISTSNDGPYSDDRQLSELRAQSIYDYLAAQGIDKKRMKYVGYGTTKPAVYPARTEEQQQQNRRVEIRILSK